VALRTSGDVRLECAKWAKADFHKLTAAWSAATAVKCRPQERRYRNHRQYARRCWRVDGEAAKLPIQADRAQAGGSDRSVARNVVDLELARIDVTQREIGVTSCVDRGDARELPIQPNRA
jgi:hypothetical protein